MAQPALRPLAVFETIDAAFTIYRRRFKDLAIIALIVLVPIQIVAYILNLALEDSLNALSPDSDAGDIYGFIGLTLLLIAISFLGTLIITGSVAKTVGDAYLDVVTGWRESMTAALRSLGRLIGNSILTSLGVFVGALFYLLPGIYLFALWATAPVTVVLEGRGPAEALGRSRDLVRGRWWPVFAVLLVAFLIEIILSYVVGIILAAFLIVGEGEPVSALATAAASLIDLIVGVVLQPFLAVVITVMYFDLRVRKEGFDLELLAQQIGRDVPERIPKPDEEWGGDPGDFPPHPSSSDDNPFG